MDTSSKYPRVASQLPPDQFMSGGYPPPGQAVVGGYPQPGQAVFDGYPSPDHAMVGAYPLPGQPVIGGYPPSGQTMVAGYPPPNQALVGAYPPPETRDQGHYTPKSCKVVRGVAIAEIALGIVCLAIGVPANIVSMESPDLFSVSGILGAPIWIGIFMVITGVIGILGSRANAYRMIVFCMVMNILGCVLSAALFGFSFTSIPIIENICSPYQRFQVYDRDTRAYRTIVGCNFDIPKISVALDSVALVASLAQFFLAIVISVLSCKSVCNCCMPQTAYTNQPAVYPMRRPIPGADLHPSDENYGYDGQPIVFTPVANDANTQPQTERHHIHINQAGETVQQPLRY